MQTEPYGTYIERSGALVLFNRKYEPIVRLAGNGVKSIAVEAHDRDQHSCVVTLPLDRIESVRPTERIEHVGQRWFYCADTAPRFDRRTRAKLARIAAAIPACRGH